MEVLVAAKHGIPVEYLYRGSNIFTMKLTFDELTQIKGELEAHMINYKVNGVVPTSSMFIGEMDFLSRYNSWSKRYQNLFKTTLINAKKIRESVARLSLMTGYNASAVRTEKKYKRYTLKLKRDTHDTSNPVVLFDRIDVSRRVPIVYLRTETEKVYIKILNEPDFRLVDYKNIIDKTSERGLLVYSLSRDSDPRNVISYTISQIYPGTSQVALETSLDWRDVLPEDEYIKTEERVIRINFNFTVDTPQDISWSAFLYAISTTEFLSRWLYLFETTSAYTPTEETIEKFYIGFRYALIQGEEAASLGNFRIIPEKGKVSLRASKVVGNEIVEAMHTFIPKLFKWFRLNQDIFIEEIKSRVPDYVHKTLKHDTIPITKYKALEIAIPDLFLKEDQPAEVEGTRYGSICQCKRQPVFIADDELDDVRGFALENGDPRTVRLFPPANPLTGEIPNGASLFFCPTEETPFPSMRVNVDPATLKSYPMVPHCVKVDNYDAMALKYYTKSDDPSENVVFVKSTSGQISSKRLDRFSIGKIEDTMKNYLRLVFDVFFEDVTFVRLGMRDVTSNSILECLRTLKSIDIDMKTFRERIFLEASAVQMYQVFWYLEEEQIDEILENMAASNEAIDSRLYISLLEETLGMSLYVISDDGYEIPSSKGFYIKNHPRDSQCAILWKYQPDTVVGYPTYDLVVPMSSQFPLGPNSLEFLDNYQDRIHKLYSHSCEFFGFKETDSVWYKFGVDVFEISERFVRELDLEEFGITLDHFGKISIRHVMSRDGRKFSLRVPPSVSTSSGSKIISEIYPASLSDITDVFGRPEQIDGALALYSFGMYIKEIGVILELDEPGSESAGYDLTETIETSRALKERIDQLLLSVPREQVKLIIGSTDRRVLEYIDSAGSSSLAVEKFVSKNEFSTSDGLARIFLDMRDFEMWNVSQSRQDFFRIDNKIEPRGDIYVYYSGKSLYFIHPSNSFKSAREISLGYLFPGAADAEGVMLFEEINGKLTRVITETQHDIDPISFSQVLRYFNGQYAAVVEVFRD